MRRARGLLDLPEGLLALVLQACDRPQGALALIKACRATWQMLRPYWATALLHILLRRRVDFADVDTVQRMCDQVYQACRPRAVAAQVVRGLLEHAPACVPEQLLHTWAIHGHLAAVRNVLPLVRDVNAADNDGDTALVLAAVNGHVEVVRALLEHPGIAVNATNNYGGTALVYAAYWDHVEVVRALLQQQAIAVNAADNEGRTALMGAAYWARVEVVRALLEHQAIAVNAADNAGRTALMRAASRGLVEVVRALLEQPGIAVNAADNAGRTALVIAQNNRCFEVVQALLEPPDRHGKARWR